ncbi:uncharacterized protein LOC131025646 [Salvia miltiorrhiza]|uniref:uncharacterized protein LOC131025646 n=1 Tax=Salvia miltiorrhiza TaxID=226208 RepID=UPI0025AB63DD|nr:uncharacterized protein LOC131025646 [Salvia miltiorrhiza]
MSNTIQNLDPALARRLADMEAIIQRIPGVPAPIKKSAESCYADLPFVDEIALYASSRKLEKISEDLYAIVQRHGEPLRDYIGRFNKEKVSITNCSEQTAVTAFRKGLLPGLDLYKTLTKYPCKTMEDVLIQAWAQIKWEEDQYNMQRVFPPSRPERDHRVDKRSGRDRRAEPYPPYRQSRERDEYDRAPDTRPREKAKIPEYALSISPAEAVEALRNLGNKVKWPERMRAPADQRDRLEVAYLLKQGHLTDYLIEKGKQTLQQERDRHDDHREATPPNPPSHERTVNVIYGGSEVSGVTHSAAKKHTRQAKSNKAETNMPCQTASTLPTQTISFHTTESDKLLHPHHDALGDGLERVQNNKKKFAVLIGFSGETKTTMGEIDLPVYAEGVNQSTKFLVINAPSAFNVILGRPWIHDMEAVPSTYHQVIRFPTKWGIKEIRGEQKDSRACYQTTMKAKQTTQ